MSDGPHRSLNMRPHWKVPAQRAANLAHTPQEVCEAMAHALKKDVLEAPIARVREILNSDTLFSDMRIDQLEALRSQHPGSAAANSLIDCAVEAAAAGRFDEDATSSALGAAVEDLARPAMRSIDEHYQREAGARASRTVRERLDTALGTLDCNAIARDLLAPSRPPSRRSVRLELQTGIDQGPPL